MESILSYLQTFDYSEEALMLFTQLPHYSFWGIFSVIKILISKTELSLNDLDR